MLLTLIRHGEALAPKAPLGDEGRALSVHGRRQASATGEALASRGLRPTQIWSSPLVRALQTAELVAAALPYEGIIAACGDLYSHSDPLDLIARVSGADPSASIIAVGHEPFMSTAAGQLLGIYVAGFSTAAAFHFELGGATSGHATLRWRWAGRFIDE